MVRSDWVSEAVSSHGLRLPTSARAIATIWRWAPDTRRQIDISVAEASQRLSAVSASA